MPSLMNIKALIKKVDGLWKLNRISKDIFWLALPIVTTVIIYILYLITHSYPAGASGLYLVMADQISMNGYHLPQTVSYYYSNSIPFSFPPLMFYVIALLRDITGISFITLTMYLPGLFMIVFLFPFYFLARELLNSKSQASLATFIIAVAPEFLGRQMTADGFVTAAAYIFTFTGLYFSYKLLMGKTNQRKWMPLSLVMFALTILTHPSAAFFFMTTFIVMYFYFNRTAIGLLYGLIVVFGSLLVTSIWWGQVVATHGVDVFLSALSFHESALFFKLPPYLSDIFTLDNSTIITTWFISILGGFYLLAKREFFLPLWAIIVLLLDSTEKTYIVESLIASVFICRLFLPQLKQTKTELSHAGQILFIALFLIFSVTVGVIYVINLPSQFDSDDIEATAWVQTQTQPNSKFAVISPVEWFPYLAKRPMVYGQWGHEWTSPSEVNRQKDILQDVRSCEDMSCLIKTLKQANLYPEYAYIPKGAFKEKINTTKNAKVVFENEGVVITKLNWG